MEFFIKRVYVVILCLFQKLFFGSMVDRYLVCLVHGSSYWELRSGSKFATEVDLDGKFGTVTDAIRGLDFVGV